MQGRRRWPLLGSLLLASLGAVACPSGEGGRAGLRVGRVGPAGAAAQAGLLPGDRLVGYRRAADPPANPQPREGKLDSCADLAELEVEEAPRGPFHLEVERGDGRLTLLVPGGEWAFAPEPVPGDPACAALADALSAREVHAPEAEEAAYAAAARWAQGTRRPLFRAWALERQGTLRTDRNDFPAAAPLLDEALRLRTEAAPGGLAEASSWHALGRLERMRGEPAKAEERFRRALALREAQAPASPERAATLNNLGILAWIGGDPAKASGIYTEALAIVRKRAPGSVGEAQILNNLGIVEREIGRLDAAEGYFQASYGITFPRDPQGVGITFILDNLGSLAFDRGNFALAESYFLATLELYRKAMPEGLEVAKCLHNLGLIAGRRLDFKAAAELLERAAAIHHRLAPGTQLEAGTLLALAENASLRGDLARARQLGEQARALVDQLSPENVDSASALVVLGRIALDGGDFVEAERLAEESLARRLAQGASGQLEARSRMLLGEVAFQQGHVQAARRQLSLALDLLLRFDPDSMEVVSVLSSLGQIERRAGRRALAEAHFAEAVAALEGQMRTLGGTEDQLGVFEETYLPIYAALANFQLARGDEAGALFTLERSRARGLLALLAQRDLSFSADLSASLRERKRSLDREHAMLQARLAALAPRQKRELAARRSELRQLNARRAALTAEIARTSPRYAALKNPRILDLAGIRRTLDPGTVYLAYTLGEETSHLFVVGASGLRVLPLATTRGAAAREVAIFRSLLLLGAGGAKPQDAKADAALRAQARRLYDLLLAPAEPHFRGAERILVSPDGALHLLPFGALRRGDRDGTFLAAWKPLHTVVSATLYGELRGRRRPPAPVASLAAFAAPAYAPVRGKAGPEDSPLRRYRLGLPPLPASLAEANALAALYGPAAQIHSGPEATERRATHLVPGTRIVHFAGHALLDRRFPLDSALALSAPRGTSLDGTDDGLLQAWEILDRVRLDADLVTLSACETGLGSGGGGEGLIGLTRAFQYAGARSILASLWSVSDRSTAELMRRFYTALQGGLPKDRALQAAQVAMLREADPALSHPYHWAAFELIGDWR